MSILGTKKNPGGKKELFDFTNGIEVDRNLCVQEIKVQKAWAQALVKVSVLTRKDSEKLCAVLDEALSLMLAGTFPWRVEDEDIHMNLESFVTQRLGELGKQMHLGRSRNDLIATTLRLFVQDSLIQTEEQVSELIGVLCKKAEESAEIIVPGTTHLQHAQPVRFGHILAAHGWAFLRDREKSRFARKQAMAAMPLGSAALVGTTLPVDLVALSSQLGFTSPPLNSYDSVGDRDYLLSALDSFSSLAMHLSRFAEDLIYWASTPVGLVRLPLNWSTGSSIMPNKRNPDVPELIRAKAAHVMSAQSNAYLLMKALPSSYDSDLHELKSVFLRAHSELEKCLSVAIPFLEELVVVKERASELLNKGHLLATEIANHLTLKGTPFREAYSQTAALVELAESKGVAVEKLDAESFKKVAPQMDPVWFGTLDFTKAVEARNQAGGTSLDRTLEGIVKLRSLTSSY